MTYAENLWLFLVFLIGIIAVPGMDMLFVLANALTGGRRSGLAATAGIVAGGAVHTLIGALGVGVILRLAPQLFTWMVFAGAAYLAWVGMGLIRSSITMTGVKSASEASIWIVFRQGAITCLLNPKAYLFVFAVYPQFMKPQFGSLAIQAVAMGILTAMTQSAIYGSLALGAAKSRNLLASSPRAILWIGRAVGLLFVPLAAAAVWHGWTLQSSGQP